MNDGVYQDSGDGGGEKWLGAVLADRLKNGVRNDQKGWLKQLEE
jgi:hypothetical protein